MKSVSRFLQEVKVELGKVVWPKFDELVGSTIVVLVIVLAFTIYLWGVNYLCSLFAKGVFSYGSSL